MNSVRSFVVSVCRDRGICAVEIGKDGDYSIFAENTLKPDEV